MKLQYKFFASRNVKKYYAIFPFKGVHVRQEHELHAVTTCIHKDTRFFQRVFSGRTYTHTLSLSHSHSLLTWKSVLPHPRIKSASPVNAIACSSQTYVTQPAQIRWNIYDIMLRLTQPSFGKHRVVFRTKIYLSLRGDSLFVIGRYDKLSSRSSARSSYLRAISRSAKTRERRRKKNKKRLQADIYYVR